MNAEIICAGTELLLGHIVNTNAVYISKTLATLGIDCYFQVTIGDNYTRFLSAIKTAAKRSDIVFITGGLGQTVDDITLKVLSKVSGVQLKYLRNVKKECRAGAEYRSIKHTCRFFKNFAGTACGIALNALDTTIICLPGPPNELEPMFDMEIAPYLQSISRKCKSVIKTRTVKLFGISECKADKKIKDLLSMAGETTVGIYVCMGIIEIKVTHKSKTAKTADKKINQLISVLNRRLGKYIFGYDDDTLESVTGKELDKNNLSLSVAESCTGGLLSGRITDISGSSVYFRLGITAYSNESKKKILGVCDEDITKYGAVSKKITIQMARNIRKIADTDIGVGISGIAGPGGQTEKKPVGLVYVSISYKNKIRTKEFLFKGDRKSVKIMTVNHALSMITNAAKKFRNMDK